MARKLKITENEKYTVGLEYGKDMENEKHT